MTAALLIVLAVLTVRTVIFWHTEHRYQNAPGLPSGEPAPRPVGRHDTRPVVPAAPNP